MHRLYLTISWTLLIYMCETFASHCALLFSYFPSINIQVLLPYLQLINRLIGFIVLP